ncbi:amino acid/peptide transporter [Novosphingobium nitrogenifigens DSM 19370]|uniref:Amino acid/peptide transporter n=1 Tax=Novosphingobium nitrogenifigens DSM 19370 TaxID=983920 RepID=F1Z5H5_9SPHN|nr:peptide MFS transporter [Novosphingobium nitrogenifigens]EGD60353.1 amino acid/peptide transporter [Novosphingobium nitrogenifigens DSM 19370]
MTSSVPDPAAGAAAAVAVETLDRSWFGHPRQLARLFATEMWERFGYYGMRALLTLYLTKHFLFSDHTANGIYGGFTAMVYLTPLVGGLLADRYLGAKRSVKFGAVIMALGYFILCFGGPTARPYALVEGVRHDVVQENVVDRPTSSGGERRYVVVDAQRLLIRGESNGTVSLVASDGHVARNVPAAQFQSGGERSPMATTLVLLAIALITIGNGFFKPNISTMVGELYRAGDRRKDAGFTIFYMGINVGALGSQILCPWLADSVGWWAGFLLAALGMLASWAQIQFDGGRLADYGNPPATEGKDRAVPIFAAALITVPLVMLLIQNLMQAEPAAAGTGILGYVLALPIMGKLLFGTFLVAVPAILGYAWTAGNRAEFQMMLAAMVLISFNTVFWTLFEQAGSSLTLFADRNTDLHVIGSFSISAAQTQFFNAFFIVTLAPLMSGLWTALGKRGLEPSTPVKFGAALAGVGAGFLLLVWGASFADSAFKVSIWWLAGLYFVHTVAELCISPVGLSMITKLSLARIVGLMMGVWFLSIAIAQYVAGIIAQVASVDTVGGEVTNPKLSLDTYVHVFTMIGWAAVVIGLVLLVIAWPLKRLMHGVN